MRGLLFVGVLVLAGCTAGSDEESSDEPTATAPSASESATGRPGRLVCGWSAEPAEGLPLPNDFVKARICEVSSSLAWRPPQEDLTDGVAGLVETINGLEPVPDDGHYCTAQGGHGYTILLATADGDVTSVSGDTGGCGDVEVGGTSYDGAEVLLEDFIARIEARREGREPPRRLANAPIDCNADEPLGPAPSLTGSLADGVRAVSCWHPDAPSAPLWRSAEVPRRQLGVLLEDLARNTVDQEHFKDPACGGQFEDYYNQMLLVQTRWGDVLRVGGVCEEYLVEEGSFWHPGARARRILAALRR
ncbi:hypothetical protein [Nocardioides gansuensis]|uniref:hypothetical protein n=1 Tax=Nocardioides gansuensis TaxID=2138300 RepID=UPI001401CCED|nr:hypothetical protein [Nocardioides gansuensis]